MSRPFKSSGHRIPWGRLSVCLLAGMLAVLRAAYGDVSVPYRVQIICAEGEKLRPALRAASDLVALEAKPPATRNLLDRRVERDTARLTEVLKSLGYYDAKIAAEIDDNAKPIRITLQVEPGKVYTIASVEVRPDQEGQTLSLPEFSQLPLKTGQPVRTEQVLDAEKHLIQILRKHGYPFPKVTNRTVELDRAEKSAALTYYVAPGPQGRFGPAHIEGLQSLDESFVRNRIPWKEGDDFNGDKLKKLEQDLVKSGLFSLVNVSTATELGSDGTVSTNVNLVERKHRTISGSISYKTDEGAGARAGWENRNLLGHAEKLELTAGISNLSDFIEGAYTRPDFLRPDQSFVLRSRFGFDRPEAYTSVSEKLSAGVERKLTDHTKVGLGAALKFSKVDQFGNVQHFGLLSLPSYLHHETSNDPIEPIRGERLHLELAPMTDVLNGNATFLKSQVDVSRYFDILEKPLTVIAGRLSVGTILGSARHDVPADERLYAGGSGSVRGYGYQLAGPLQDKKPVGGKSMLALSCEYRVRVQDRIDLIAFVDAGNAYTTELPDIGDLKFGSGLGVAYYSRIGPIRLDVAFPVERRAGIDDAFQVYVNLGQSF